MALADISPEEDIPDHEIKNFSQFFNQNELEYKKKPIERCLSPVRDSDSPKTKKRKKRSQTRKNCTLRKKIEKKQIEKKQIDKKMLPQEILDMMNCKLFPVTPKPILQLVYLTPMPTSINPIVSVRVMDHIFSLDSSFKNSLIPYENFKPLFGDIKSFKRTTRVTQDTNTGIFTFFIEERFPEKWKIFKGEETFGYFKEW